VSKTASPVAEAPSVTTAPSAPAAPVADIQSVDIASLELHRPRSVGVEQLGLWAMQQLGFHRIAMHQPGHQWRPTARTIIGSIIARMARTGSNGGASLAGQTSGLGELLECGLTKRCR